MRPAVVDWIVLKYAEMEPNNFSNHVIRQTLLTRCQLFVLIFVRYQYVETEYFLPVRSVMEERDVMIFLPYVRQILPYVLPDHQSVNQDIKTDALNLVRDDAETDSSKRME